MTTSMRMQQRIRQMDGDGMDHAAIARELGISRTTVVKYANMEDLSPRPRAAAGSRSRVARYADVIEGWLLDDLRMPRKQRHTAKRVYERLVAECGYEGAYPSVQRWVKRWREEHRAEGEGFAELSWHPGVAQVDFGQARAVLAGRERTVHFLVVSFPYSNMRCVVACPGEDAACVCHGLSRVFSHVGMAPRVLVFDNATGVGHRRGDGSVTMTGLYEAFAAHYGIETRFCNPRSGHEKGSVENAVGFVRRNLMVPIPSAEGWEALSDAWLEACDRIAQRGHWRKGEPIGALFDAERAHMRPLPGVAFDACDWRSARCDKTGVVTVNARHYLAGARYGRMRVRVGVRALSVEIRCMDNTPDRHAREAMGARPGDAGLAHEPAFRHSPQAARLDREPDTRRDAAPRARPARPDGGGRQGRPAA